MSQRRPRLFLGLDIGGTSAKYGYVTANGQILEKGSFPTGTAVGRDMFLRSFARIVGEAVQRQVGGIGICSLGIIHGASGEILGGVQNMPYLKGMRLLDMVKSSYPEVPVTVCNDISAIAFGEQWLGAAKGCRDFACIALGTGVGGALILNAQLVEGAHFRAGEIGYWGYENDQTYLERYASTKAVMEAAARELGVEAMDGVAFFERVRQRDTVCVGLFHSWVDTLARCIANMGMLLDLEKTIIGGGVSMERDVLIPPLVKAVDRMLPAEFRGQMEIVAAHLANDAGMLGAVYRLLQRQTG